MEPINVLSKQKLEEKLEFWMEKFDKDTEMKQNELNALKAARAGDLAHLQDLAKTVRKQSPQWKAEHPRKGGWLNYGSWVTPFLVTKWRCTCNPLSVFSHDDDDDDIHDGDSNSS